MNWSLDIFHFNTVSGGNPLICATYIAFKRRNIFSKFKILPRMFIKYISSIQVCVCVCVCLRVCIYVSVCVCVCVYVSVS